MQVGKKGHHVGGHDIGRADYQQLENQKEQNQTIRKVCLGIFQAIGSFFKAIHSGFQKIFFKATKTTPAKSVDPKQSRLNELKQFQQNFTVLNHLRNTNTQVEGTYYDPGYGETVPITYWKNESQMIDLKFQVEKNLSKFMKKHIGKPEDKLSKPQLWDSIKTLVAEKFKIDLQALAGMARVTDAEKIPALLEQRFEKYQNFALELYKTHTSKNTYSDLQRALQSMEQKDSNSSRKVS